MINPICVSRFYQYNSLVLHHQRQENKQKKYKEESQRKTNGIASKRNVSQEMSEISIDTDNLMLKQKPGQITKYVVDTVDLYIAELIGFPL